MISGLEVRIRNRDDGALAYESKRAHQRRLLGEILCKLTAKLIGRVLNKMTKDVHVFFPTFNLGG